MPNCRNHKKYFEHALKVRRLIMDDFLKAFENFHLLVTPTTLTSAPPYNEYITKANREQCALQDYCTQPVNMAGNSLLFILLTNYNDYFRRSSTINSHKTIKIWNAAWYPTHSKKFKRTSTPGSC